MPYGENLNEEKLFDETTETALAEHTFNHESVGNVTFVRLRITHDVPTTATLHADLSDAIGFARQWHGHNSPTSEGGLGFAVASWVLCNGRTPGLDKAQQRGG